MKTPEKEPTSEAVGENNEFNSWLVGMLEEATLGRTSRNDFLMIAIGDLEKRGMDLDSFRLSEIMKYSFGTREEVKETTSGMSQSEFEEKFPGDIGEAVRWYIQPSRS